VQFLHVVDIAQVQKLFVVGREPGNAAVVHRNAQLAKAFQSGFDFGDQLATILAGHIDGEPLRAKEATDFRTEFDQNLVELLRGMDAIGQRLQRAQKNDRLAGG